jgi:hypothetical protein
MEVEEGSQRRQIASQRQKSYKEFMGAKKGNHGPQGRKDMKDGYD